jgi:hypothetical protein
MPFKSQSQARAAFGGYLGPEMQERASQWAHETPGGIHSLPQHKAPPRHGRGKKKHALASKLAAHSK